MKTSAIVAVLLILIAAVSSFYASFLIYPTVSISTTTQPEYLLTTSVQSITTTATTYETTTLPGPGIVSYATVTTTSISTTSVTVNRTVTETASPSVYYFHYDPSIASVNGITTYGAIFNTSNNVGSGKVYSGQTVSLSFFGPPLASPENLTGVARAVFYINSNVANATGKYQVSLSYVNQAGQTISISSSPLSAVVLLGGSGSPPFSAFESDISVSNSTVPAGGSSCCTSFS